MRIEAEEPNDGGGVGSHLDMGGTKPVDVQLDEADADRYDGLVLPGGVADPDMTRTVPDAVAFVRCSSIRANRSRRSVMRRGCSSKRTSCAASD